MEIERKYLINTLPKHLEQYKCRQIEQGYLCTDPVIRIRQDNEQYELTYKSHGKMAREEYTLPLTEESYKHLKQKVDGRVICKNRYLIPLTEILTIELDIFKDDLAPLVIAEVEFPDLETANSFIPPDWFGEDVTFSGNYHNSALSQI